MNMYYGQTQGYAPFPPQQAPAYGYAPQPQYQSPSSNNISVATGLIQNAVNHLVNSRMVTIQEGQHILNMLNSNVDNVLTQFQQSVIKTFGDNAISQQDLFTFTISKIEYAIKSLRDNMSKQNTVLLQTQSLNNRMNAIQPQQGFTGQSTISDIADMYGTGNPMPNLQQTLNSQQPINPVTPPTHNPTPSIPTNKPYEIDMNDPSTVWMRPIFTEVPVPKRSTSIDEEIIGMETITYGQKFSVQNNSEQINVTVAAVTDPVTSTDAAIAIASEEIVHNNAANEKFVDVINFDELTVLDMPFEEGKRIYDDCKSAMKSNDLNELIKILEREGMGAAQLARFMLWMFNQAAQVNFVRVTDEGTKRLNPINTLAELSRLITDSGDYEDWKVEPDKFKRALTLTMRASIGRLFNKEFIGYLDIKDHRSQALIMSADSLNFKFSDGSTNRTVYANMLDRMQRAPDEESLKKARTTNDKIQKEIETKLKDTFPLLIQHKIALHNLSITNADVDARDFRPRMIQPGAYTLFWEEILKREGVMELIRNREDSVNPLIMGQIYNSTMILKRIIR